MKEDDDDEEDHDDVSNDVDKTAPSNNPLKRKKRTKPVADYLLCVPGVSE